MAIDKSELFVVTAFNSAGHWTVAVDYAEFEKFLIPDVGILGRISKDKLLAMRSDVLCEALRCGFNSSGGWSRICYVDRERRGLDLDGVKGMKILLHGGVDKVASRKGLDEFKDWMVKELGLIFGFVSAPFFVGPSVGFDNRMVKALGENEGKMLADLESFRIADVASAGGRLRRAPSI